MVHYRIGAQISSHWCRERWKAGRGNAARKDQRQIPGGTRCTEVDGRRMTVLYGDSSAICCTIGWVQICLRYGTVAITRRVRHRCAALTRMVGTCKYIVGEQKEERRHVPNEYVELRVRLRFVEERFERAEFKYQTTQGPCRISSRKPFLA